MQLARVYRDNDILILNIHLGLRFATVSNNLFDFVIVIFIHLKELQIGRDL